MFDLPPYNTHLFGCPHLFWCALLVRLAPAALLHFSARGDLLVPLAIGVCGHNHLMAALRPAALNPSILSLFVHHTTQRPPRAFTGGGIREGAVGCAQRILVRQHNGRSRLCASPRYKKCNLLHRHIHTNCLEAALCERGGAHRTVLRGSGGGGRVAVAQLVPLLHAWLGTPWL